MNICPTCDEEFLEHVNLCSTCGEKLIKAEERASKTNIAQISKEDLLKEETVSLSEGSLEHCREFEKILSKSQIPVVVYPAKLGCDDHNTATLGASCAMKYLVLVREIDLGRCKDALEGQFHAAVSREGQGNYVSDVVDISQEEIVCPACGEKGALNNGECRACGLFLGEHN